MERKESNLKSLDVIHSFNLRDLIKKINESSVQKEDVLTILSEGDKGYSFIYYK